MIISSTRTGRRWWRLAGVGASGALLAWAVLALIDHGGGAGDGRRPASPSLHGAGQGPVVARGGVAPVDAGARGELPAPTPVTGAIGPVGTWHVQAFRADGQGRLVLDGRTLRTLEQVHAFNGPDGAPRAAEDAAGSLPAQARQQAVELARQYGRYDAALRQTVNPDQAPTSVDDMVSQFKAMQALRQEQFGADVAQRLFGEQEAVTARLLQLMQEDAQPQDSLEDKAARAQARLAAERMTGSGS